MYKNKLYRKEHGIVDIHQPHIRSIVRGKANAKVEFGAKINVSLMNEYTFLDDLL
jgi:transposase, IS5 family